MADQYDPYREALVMELATVWPEEFDDWEPAERARIEERLHSEPAEAAELRYVRTHTGFRREIIVTAADLERLRG